jgi:hypothetical protein
MMINAYELEYGTNKEMGEFTQNLLKLTEFPFSYSLMGLLALIFGQETSLGDELSFARLAPLLILMGFVATTLSICDPVGTIQRRLIKRPELHLRVFTSFSEVMYASIFGKDIADHFPRAYLFAIIFSPEGIKKQYPIDWDSTEDSHAPVETNVSINTELHKIGEDDSQAIGHLLEGLKQQTVMTKWITAEVDRITALVYFMIIISLFIPATLIYPVFPQNFVQVFGNVESTKVGILIISMLALTGVSIMFKLRISGLLNKASIVFRYLTALGAIKTETDTFRTTLQNIEKYLNDNDWTLANYWLDRIQREYTQLFFKKSQEPKE